jgi:hypothetical protein
MPTARLKLYEPIQAGTYHLLAKECKIRTAKKDGSEFLAWTFEVLDDELLSGKTFDWTSSMEFGKGSKAYALLRACGMAEVTEESDIDTDSFLGSTFYAKVTVEKSKSDGSERNRIEAFWSEAEYEKELDKFAQKKAQAVHSVAKAAPAAAEAHSGEPVEAASPEASGVPVAKPTVGAKAGAPVAKPAIKRDLGFPR